MWRDAIQLHDSDELDHPRNTKAISIILFNYIQLSDVRLLSMMLDSGEEQTTQSSFTIPKQSSSQEDRDTVGHVLLDLRPNHITLTSVSLSQ